MRYGIIADIHGNLEAMRAVLDDCRQEAVENIICLGDIVGYGADPAACLDIVMERGITSVAGNHDWAVVEKFSTEFFNPIAAEAVAWTQKRISSQQRHYLENLPLMLETREFVAVHGMLNHPEQFFYLRDIEDARDTFYLMKRSVCFVGHTHVAMVLKESGGLVEFERSVDFDLKDGVKYIINPGSVGQPRDGDARASYVIFDTAIKRIHLKRLDYDVATAQRKINALGLPSFLAARLSIGQ